VRQHRWGVFTFGALQCGARHGGEKSAGTKGAQGWGPQKPPVLVVVAGSRVFGASVCQATAESAPLRSADSFLKTTSEMRRLRHLSASLSDFPSASLRR
jgi:hypothetical protein